MSASIAAGQQLVDTRRSDAVHSFPAYTALTESSTSDALSVVVLVQPIHVVPTRLTRSQYAQISKTRNQAQVHRFLEYIPDLISFIVCMARWLYQLIWGTSSLAAQDVRRGPYTQHTLPYIIFTLYTTP